MREVCVCVMDGSRCRGFRWLAGGQVAGLLAAAEMWVDSGDTEAGHPAVVQWLGGELSKGRGSAGAGGGVACRAACRAACSSKGIGRLQRRARSAWEDFGALWQARIGWTPCRSLWA